MDERPEWFAPKRYGFGAGPPIAWQGWALCIALVAVVVFAFHLFGSDNPRALAIIVPAILGFLIIAAKTTKGGFRWHWGDDE